MYTVSRNKRVHYSILQFIHPPLLFSYWVPTLATGQEYQGSQCRADLGLDLMSQSPEKFCVADDNIFESLPSDPHQGCSLLGGNEVQIWAGMSNPFDKGALCPPHWPGSILRQGMESCVQILTSQDLLVSTWVSHLLVPSGHCDFGLQGS